MTILQKVIGAFADAFSWLQEHLADRDVVNAIYEDLGADPIEAGDPPKFPKANLESIARYRDAVDPTPEAFLEAFDDVVALIEALANIKDKNGRTDESLVHGVLGLLVTNYARFNWPILYWFAEPVFFLEGLATSDPVVKGNTVAFTNGLKKVGAFTLDSFRNPFDSYDKAKDFISNFDEHFPLKTEADAKRLADFTLLPLAIALAYFEKGLLEKQTESPTPFGRREAVLIADSIYGWDPSPVSTTPVADRIADRTLTFSLIGIKEETADEGELKGAINCTMTWVPSDHGDPGLLFALGGSGQVESELGDGWKLVVKMSSASAMDFLIRKGAPLVNGPIDGSASFTIEKPLRESGLPNVFPDRKGTRLEFERIAFSGEISSREAGVKMLAQNSALVLAVNKDGDGFLKEILSAGETRIAFDLGLGLSSERGFYIEGGTGLEVVLPIGRKLGPVTVHQLLLSLVATTEAKPAHITTEISVGLSVKLGPVEASVDRLGFQMRLAFPEKGKPDFSVGFKPPNGVGLSIDAAGVTGGGFLTFDPGKGQYAGVVQLNLESGITVKGVGLIATRLPNNKKGFSLLIIITAEKLELQLGLGFMLTGIGGLLAINRTFDQDALRTGLKNHTLDSVLFPKDPIRNAPQILSNLNKVFPPAKGHHLFGPMVQITWRKLITMNLGLILEIGARLRLLVLGQVLAILPKPEHDLIRLQLDAIGVIDFDQGTASLDATLYDSRLVNKFVLTGDMAMRLKWESPRNFALAVGGLHPAFNPPPNFPKLERIAINLTTGDNPRLRCEAYFAITSNTVQFGARAELFASAHGFSIHGELGFDVLIQLDPFHFVADFRAQVQLKRGSTNLFKVKLEGELSGPRPLHIKGKATFEIFWWDVSIRFDKTLIEGAKPPRPDPVEVLPLLKEALGNSANWVGVLPNGLRQMATLRPRQGGANEVLLHPLGTLTVKQSVVPLNTSISRFGPAAPAGARLFRISGVSLGGNDELPQTVTDFFAPAQFNDMSDDEKLSSPSFEPMAAGVSFGSDEFTFPPEKAGPTSEANWLEAKTIEFETIIIDKERNETRSDRGDQSKPKYQLLPGLLAKQFRFGAAGASDLRRTGRDKYRAATGKYKVTKEGWSIVATGDLSVQPVAGVEAGKSATYSEAVQALRVIKRQDLTKASGLKVMRLSELK